MTIAPTANPCQRPGCGGTILSLWGDLSCTMCARPAKPVAVKPAPQSPIPKRPLQEAQAEYHRLRAAGSSIEDAALEMGLAVSTINYWERIADRQAEAGKFARRGFTVPTIAAKLGVSRQVVARDLAARKGRP